MLTIDTKPLTAAVAKLRAKTPVGTRLRTAELQDLPLAFRERGQFSAGMESTRMLSDIQTRLEAALTQANDGTGMFRDRFIAELRDVARAAGFLVKSDGGFGALTDFTSVQRLGLIWDVQTQQAAGYAQYASGQDADVLDAFPAQELVRMESRLVPRDWRTRWALAGGRTYGGRMIALKTDAIWQRISAFGTPWPPFDFNSGMGVMDVDRGEAERLGLIARDAEIAPSLPAFNAGLQASVSNLTPEAKAKLQERFGAEIQFDGDTAKWVGAQAA